jgi:hypothetical protein
MPQTVPQRRVLGLALFAVGMLPLIGAATWVASAFVLPSVYRGVIDLFIPPGLDAPDNWAVAFTRMVWLFIVSGSIGLVLSSVGLWLSRRAG